MLATIFAVFAFCFVLERLVPGWPLPQVRTWPLRVLLINAAQLGVVLLAGLTWERWLSSASVFHLSEHVPPWAGGVIAYFIATFIFYWWHRWHNYGDITWWDMLFGTYENPKEWVHTCGFDDAREQQLVRMLAYKDVHDGT